MIRASRLAAGMFLLSVVTSPALAASASPPPASPPPARLVPRMAPVGGLELHYSPASAGARRVSAWNASIDDQRAYVRLDADGAPIAEGITYTPALRLGPGDARLRRLARSTRYTFTALAPATSVHLAYGADGTEARASVWSTGALGRRLHFEGRATRPELTTLVEWTWKREFVRICGDLAYQASSPRASRAVERLPERFFR